jgi:hypothetical protein
LSMRMAHIIMAYKDPSQVERLVKKMSHPNFDFYIHVDSKFDQGPFEYLASIERVYLVKNRKKNPVGRIQFHKICFGLYTGSV